MRVIDFHNHYYPPAYLDALRAGPSTVKVTIDADGNPCLHYPGDYNVAVPGHRDIDYRERVLKEHNVDTQVITLTTPGTHVETPEMAVRLSRLVNDAFMLEFLQSHTNVVRQPGFDQRGFGNINPYAMGFAMFQDLKRICADPTPEDRRWFPEIAGTDWRKTLDFAMRNFKDESFIGQFLSPKLMRDFRFFAIADHEAETELLVDSIHDESGYRRLRKLLCQQYARETYVPDIQVVRYEREGDRSLTLSHFQYGGRPLVRAAGFARVSLVGSYLTR